MPAAKERKTSFKTLQKFGCDYSPATFTVYESERTGLRSVVVDRKGPKTYGFFALATEIHDDSGAPHTLEHLIFMGSKNYKYKGVLDKLATRAYSGTNAWTATDHTAYTLESAGWDGFAQILPVYLEHVLLPTLTDAGCYTEVHHIDGTGNDAGVVYSEMQGVQNQQSELMELHARRLIYPEGDGFRYETGGMMEQLRVLSPDRIREFHRAMYQPKNLCLVLAGEIDHDQLLDILDSFEDTILEEVPPIDAPFKRPWVESKRTPLLNKTTIDVVEFPEEDEEYGEILIGFFGPECTNDLLDTATNVLLTYLAESSISVLINTLVEKEELCSQVYHQTDTRPDILIWFTLTSVETKKLASVEKRFIEVLRDTAEKPLDMPYMKECLARFRRQIKYATESGSSVFTDHIINDHLFAKRDGESLKASLSSLSDLDTLDDWSEEQWKKFFKTWLIDAHHVSVLGTPSAKLSKKLKDDEQARVKAQQEKLGEEGLKKLSEKLKEAQAENDKPVPPEMLEKFEIPGTESIHFFPTVTARSGLAKKLGHLDNEIQQIIDKDESGLPLYIHVEHVQTSFVHANIILSTSSIPLELKPLLPLYLDNFFTTPITRDGKRVEFEEMVAALEKDTISYEINPGSSLGCSELIRIKFIVEQDKYVTTIQWIRDLLLNSIFDAKRLSTTATKLLADIPDDKRSGNEMAHAIDSMIHLAPASSSRAQNTLVKALYLKRVAKQLKSNPEVVIAKMEELRSSLVKFDNARAFLIANVKTLANPISSWTTLSESLGASDSLRPLDTKRAVLSDAGRNPGTLATITPLATTDSSFLILTTRGLSSYTDPQLPALIVAMKYLDAVEGPMWVGVRGTGLAYGTGFSRSTDTGILTFRVYRSPDAFKAYNAAKQQVEDLITGNKPFEKHALEGAVSGVVVGFADEEPTMAYAAENGFTNLVVRGIEKTWKEEILKKVRQVTVPQIKEALTQIIMPAFDPKKANLVVTCGTIMADQLKKDFEGVGFSPEIKPLADFQDDYGLKPEDGDEDPEDDDDEDDDDEDEDDEDDEEDDEEDN